FKIFRVSSFSSPPWNGGSPQSISYRRAPSDHQSTALVYPFLTSISGTATNNDNLIISCCDKGHCSSATERERGLLTHVLRRAAKSSGAVVLVHHLLGQPKVREAN